MSRRRDEPTDPFTVLIIAVVGGGLLPAISFGVDPFVGFIVLSVASLVATIAGVAYAVVWGLRVNRHEELMIEHYVVGRRRGVGLSVAGGSVAGVNRPSSGWSCTWAPRAGSAGRGWCAPADTPFVVYAN